MRPLSRQEGQVWPGATRMRQLQAEWHTVYILRASQEIKSDGPSVSYQPGLLALRSHGALSRYKALNKLVK